MEGRSYSVIELPECPGLNGPLAVERPWVLPELFEGFCAQCPKEMTDVQARKPVFEKTSPGREVIWHADDRRSVNQTTGMATLLAQPLGEDIPAERNAARNYRSARCVGSKLANDDINILCVPRVVHPASGIHPAVAGAEEHQVATPATGLGECQQSVRVFCADCSLEAMQHH
jgi:hypothetical protein